MHYHFEWPEISIRGHICQDLPPTLPKKWGGGGLCTMTGSSSFLSRTQPPFVAKGVGDSSSLHWVQFGDPTEKSNKKTELSHNDTPAAAVFTVSEHPNMQAPDRGSLQEEVDLPGTTPQMPFVNARMYVCIYIYYICASIRQLTVFHSQGARLQNVKSQLPRAQAALSDTATCLSRRAPGLVAPSRFS